LAKAQKVQPKSKIKTMKLKKYSTAPAFKTTDTQGNEVSLSDYKGKKLLLSFYRNMYCPFCNMRVHQLSKLYPELKSKGLEMLFVFETAAEHLNRSSFHNDVFPIKLIGNPEKNLYALYDIEKSTLKVLATFFKVGTFKALSDGKNFNVPKGKDENSTENLIPADFLIDEEGIIRHAHYGNNLRDHIEIELIEKFSVTPSKAFTV
jgi:peroxiredoxin